MHTTVEDIKRIFPYCKETINKFGEKTLENCPYYLDLFFTESRFGKIVEGQFYYDRFNSTTDYFCLFLNENNPKRIGFIILEGERWNCGFLESCVTLQDLADTRTLLHDIETIWKTSAQEMIDFFSSPEWQYLSKEYDKESTQKFVQNMIEILTTFEMK